MFKEEELTTEVPGRYFAPKDGTQLEFPGTAGTHVIAVDEQMCGW